jgi:restriction endonuclease Mrr
VKFFLDANETAVILPVLAQVFGDDHVFRTAAEENLADVDDIPLFAELRKRRFDALITRDKNQLADSSEREALRNAELHWIGHAEPKVRGREIITTLGAGYLAAFPHVVEALEAATAPTSCRVKAVPRQRGQRLSINLIGP